MSGLQELHKNARSWLHDCRRVSNNGQDLKRTHDALNDILTRLEGAAGKLDLHELLSLWMLLIEDLGALSSPEAGSTQYLQTFAQDCSAQAAGRLVQALTDRSLRTSPATKLEVLTILAQHLLINQGGPIPIEILTRAAEGIASRLDVDSPGRAISQVTAQAFTGRTSALLGAVVDTGASVELRGQRKVSTKGGSGACKKVPLLFSTFRRLDRRYSNSYLKYGAKWQDELAYGAAEVSIPLSRLTFSGARDLAREQDLKKHPEIDRSEYFVLEQAEPIADRPKFLSQLRQVVDKKTLFVFVHGFRQTHADALIHAAQTFNDLALEGAPLVLSWPSGFVLGSPSYEQAIAEYVKRRAPEAFGGLIKDAAAAAGAEQILLAGHSLGCRMLCDITRHFDLGDKRITNLVLASPDIEVDSFSSATRPAMNAGKKIHVYASRSDRALQVASWLYDPRAGAYPARITSTSYDKLEIVATEGCFYDYPDFWRHSDFSCGAGSDLQEALRNHSPAKRRLEERKTGRGSYWAIG